MSDKRNQLLVAALRRAGKPTASDDLLDAATGLALAEGWEPEQVSELNRRSVATRLRNLEQAGVVRQEGAGMDERARRTTPLFVPVAGWDVRAAVPAPPMVGASPTRRRESPYAGLNNTQLLALLEAHDDIAECLGRFLMDMGVVREKARRNLLAAGLELQ